MRRHERVFIRGSVWAGPGESFKPIFEFFDVSLEDNDVDFRVVDERLDVLLEFDCILDRYFNSASFGDSTLDTRIGRTLFKVWSHRDDHAAVNIDRRDRDRRAGIKI